MATGDNYTGPEKEEKRSIPSGMIATSIILGLALIFLIFMYFDQRHKKIEMETMLTEEKDSLATELRGMVMAYDTLRTNNDTLNAGLAREKQRIVNLLKVNASNVQLIKRYKNEITTMRDIMKSYIVQIDSLNSRNKLLSDENVEIKQQINEIRTTNTELSQAREELTSKVELGSVIKAKDIVVTPLNKNRKETRRLNYLENLRVCFTLRENPLARAGSKEVYLRILRPDSLIITGSSENVFAYGGIQIPYSASREVEYTNQDVEMCIFIAKNSDFVTGNYSLELYLENNLIGSTTFAITK